MALVVAEISGNHGGDKQKLCDMICAAAGAGADFAKFQLYLPEDMPDADEDGNRAMYEKLHVRKEWLPDLFKTASFYGIGLFASVFSVRAIEELRPFKPPLYKFASTFSTLLPNELYRAMRRAIGDTAIISTEPLLGPWILSWNDYRPEHFGLSDHTADLAKPLRALMWGARMIEKHFKLDNDCVDAEFSCDLDTLRTLCRIAHHV